MFLDQTFVSLVLELIGLVYFCDEDWLLVAGLLVVGLLVFGLLGLFLHLVLIVRVDACGMDVTACLRDSE